MTSFIAATCVIRWELIEDKTAIVSAASSGVLMGLREKLISQARDAAMSEMINIIKTMLLRMNGLREFMILDLQPNDYK
jgi:hypothetical protein